MLAPLANYLRPMLLNSWMERRKAAFTENSQKMKRVIDNLQRKLDEVMADVPFFICFKNFQMKIFSSYSPFLCLLFGEVFGV